MPNTEEVVQLVEKLGADLPVTEYAEWTKSVVEELTILAQAAAESEASGA